MFKSVKKLTLIKKRTPNIILHIDKFIMVNIILAIFKKDYFFTSFMQFILERK